VCVVTNGDHKELGSDSRRSSSSSLSRARGESIIKLQKLQQLINIPRLDHRVSLGWGIVAWQQEVIT